ncbi:MAG: HAD family hydrolase [Acidobacteria bacterium]|nr:HAD family hydrolase [Acidobacteriota bacterium]
MSKAVFLDRDGTLCADKVYLSDPQGLEPLPGVFPALESLQRGGFRLVVVTNQSGVARGLIPPGSLEAVHRELHRIFGERGVRFEAIYVCPHLPGGAVAEYSIGCDCRKPSPGLLLQAAEDLGIDLRRSFMVGDQGHDVEAGKRAGCRTVRLDLSGSGKGEATGAPPAPDFEAASWESAARWILSQEDE